MTSAHLRVGIVGAPRGGSFVGALRAIAETELVAVCDREPAALASFVGKYGAVATYANYEAMLDRAELDIVIVASPMHLHVPMAVAALERGIHVLSEVTAAVSLAQCYELLQVVRTNSAQYMMAENCTYMKPNVLIRAMVEAGVFGEVYYAEGEYIHEMKSYHHQPDGSPRWRYHWQVGRNGATYPTHSLGPCMQWVRDPIRTVTCLGTGRWTDPEHIMEDTVYMMCKTEQGKLIRIRQDLLSNRPHRLTGYGLQGTRGCYENYGEPRVWLMGDPPGQWRDLSEFEAEFLPPIWRDPTPEQLAAGHGGSDYIEVRDFVDSILNGTEPPISIYDALEWTAAGLISEESIGLGGVPLPMPRFREYGRLPRLPSMDIHPHAD